METFANNASSTLSAGISDSDTSLSVASGEGALWPALAGDDWCWSTITDGVNIEIIRITARSSDAFTILRGQQGTTALTWSSGATVQMRLTRGTLESLRDGVGLDQRLVLATGWSATDYLQSASGVLNGATDFTVMVMGRMARVEDEDGVLKCFISCGGLYFSGYAIGYSSQRPFVKADAGGDKYSSGVNFPNWSTGLLVEPYSWGFIDWKSVCIALRHEAGVLTMIINMVDFREINISSNGTYTPGATGMRVGADVDGSQPFTNGGIAGIAYIESAVAKDTIRDAMRACMEANDVVDGGVGWTTLHSFKQMLLRAGDAVPSTVNDLVGSADLTLTGSLTIIEERPRWL